MGVGGASPNLNSCMVETRSLNAATRAATGTTGLMETLLFTVTTQLKPQLLGLNFIRHSLRRGDVSWYEFCKIATTKQ